MRNVAQWTAIAVLFAAPVAAVAAARLIADINSYHGNPPGNFEDAPPNAFVSTNERLFFSVDDGIHGRELWTSDGTPAGTAIVQDLAPGLDDGFGPDNPVLTIGDVLFFSAAVPGVSGPRLWRSDGTASGTTTVHGSVQPASLTEFEGQPWFIGRLGTGAFGLWRSDGTSEGTFQVATTQERALPEVGHELRAVGEQLFFVTGSAGETALWVSNGTSGGTRKLLSGAQILPRAELHSQGSGVLLFSYRESAGQENAELWRSDGTAAGTFFLSATLDFSQGRVLAADGQAFLNIDQHIFRSDGSTTGSYALASNAALNDPAEDPAPWQYASSQLFYLGEGQEGRELWASDDNEGSVALVRDINPGPDGSDIADMDTLNGQLVFSAFREGTGFALWASDGTEAGTRLLADPNPGTDRVGNCWCGRKLTVAAGDVYFSSYQPSVGTELWRYQSSTGRVAMTRDITSGGASSRFGEQFSFNGRIVFSSSGTDNPLELLWISDGSFAGTQLLSELKAVNHSSNPYLMQSLERGLILAATNTEVETVQAGDVSKVSGSGNTYERRTQRLQIHRLMDDLATVEVVFANQDNPTQPFRPFYSADTSLIRWGDEYLYSDGSQVLVRALGQEEVHNTWKSAYAHGILAGNPQDGDTMYYLASGELWATDGTAPGTRMFVDAAELPTPQNSIQAVKILQGRLYVSTSGLDDDPQRIWRQQADGRFQQAFEATSGDEQVQDFAAAATQLFVITGSSEHRERLYRVDAIGSDRSPQVLLDITGRITAPITLGDALIFLAEQGELGAPAPPGGVTGLRPPAPPYTYIETDGAEPWVSDGSPTGTRLLRDIREGAQSSKPSAMHELGNRIIFAANDGIHGNELWETDGTTQGTRLIKDIYPGIASGLPSEGASELAIFDGTLVFQATSGDEGLELWISDGSESGTLQKQDIQPGPGSSSPKGFTAYRQHLVFVANDGRTGREPWITPISAIIPMDFGDAPKDRYPTMLTDNGARHRVGTLYLGETVDAEIDAWQDSSSIANGDDSNDGLDEDGVEFHSLSLDAAEGRISVTISQPGTGQLDGWIDLNQDGDWDDAGEQILRRAALSTKVNQLRFPLPRTVGDDDGSNNTSLSGKTFARFRLSSGPALQPSGVQPDGSTPNGEVEDYLVRVEATAPQPTPTPQNESPTPAPQPSGPLPLPTAQTTPPPTPSAQPTTAPAPTQAPTPTVEPVTAEAEENSANADGASGSGLLSPWFLILGLVVGIQRRTVRYAHPAPLRNG